MATKRTFQKQQGRTIHGDNLFNYGYVGQFNTQWEPTFVRDTNGVHQDGYRQVLAGYKLSDLNRVLANYNRDANGKDLEAGAGGNNLNVFNSIFNQSALQNVWTFHQNVGQVYNAYLQK